MRQGELLGLRWEDVDLEGGSLTVAHSLNHGQLAAPKTDRSRRTLRLGAEVRAALHDQQHRQRLERLRSGRNWSETGFVFTTTTGQPLDWPNGHLTDAMQDRAAERMDSILAQRRGLA
jgi:integrase